MTDITKWIDEQEKICEKATPVKKWKTDVWWNNDGGFAAVGPLHNRESAKSWGEDDPEDANGQAAKLDQILIASSRTSLPKALAALRVALDFVPHEQAVDPDRNNRVVCFGGCSRCRLDEKIQTILERQE